MVEVNRVMVGVDFSDDADRSIGGALHIAQLHGADVYGVHVIDSRPEDDLENPAVEHQHSIEDALEAHMVEIAQRRQPAFDREHLRWAVRVGRPTEQLLAAADEIQADVVVVGHRGKGFLERTLLGSVAATMVRRAKQPLIVTRGWDRETSKKVLAAINLGDDSARMIHIAADWAERIGGELHVLYAWEVAGMVDSYCALPGVPNKDVDCVAIRDGFARIEAIAEKALGANHGAHLHVRAGIAAYEIVHSVRQDNMGLVVMGSHGRRGLSKLFLGNTAEQVVERAPCSVLVLRV